VKTFKHTEKILHCSHDTSNLNVQSVFFVYINIVLDLLSVIKKEASLWNGLRDGPLLRLR